MKLICENLKFLALWVAIFLLVNVKTSRISEKSLNMNMFGSSSQNGAKSKMREMTEEEKQKFDKIKKPDLPDSIPEDVKFMQREISKSYFNAKTEFNPRFVEAEEKNKKFMSLFPPDERAVGVPVNREG